MNLEQAEFMAEVTRLMDIIDKMVDESRQQLQDMKATITRIESHIAVMAETLSAQRESFEKRCRGDHT
jgi:peptidoglycan hydrolase CwlO-like protein